MKRNIDGTYPIGWKHSDEVKKKISKTKTKLEKIAAICKCGIEFKRKPDHGRMPVYCSRKCCDTYGARSGKKNTLHQKETVSKLFSGAGNRSWRGGVTPHKVAVRNTKEYRSWRTNVFERDNYTCVKCNTRGGHLNADHILAYFLGGALLDLENGQTLCIKCHREKTKVEMSQNWSNQYSIGRATDSGLL